MFGNPQKRLQDCENIATVVCVSRGDVSGVWRRVGVHGSSQTRTRDLSLSLDESGRTLEESVTL